jgi:serine/threonine protein kinase
VEPKQELTFDHKMLIPALLVQVSKQGSVLSLNAREVELVKPNKSAMCSRKTHLLLLRHEVEMLKRCVGKSAICQMIDIADYSGHSKQRKLRKVVFYEEHFPYDLDSFLYLRTKEPLSEEVLKECIVELFHILLALEKLGIVHNNIKTEHILIKNTSEGVRVATCDLSLAKRINSRNLLENPPDMFCNARYISPERFRFRQGHGDTDPAGHASDLWAMGCSIFFLMTNTFPAWCILTEYLINYSILEDQMRKLETKGVEIMLETQELEDHCIPDLSEENLARAKTIFQMMMDSWQSLYEEIRKLEPKNLGNLENDACEKMELFRDKLHQMQEWLIFNFLEDLGALINLVPEGATDNKTYFTLMADTMKKVIELMIAKTEEAWVSIPGPASTHNPFISLVYRMLRPNPEERITAEEGLGVAMAINTIEKCSLL